MTKYKFNIDPSDLPDEQINKHKDFKKLMYNYQSATKPLYKIPLYKNKKAFVIILLILLMIFVIFKVMDDEAQQEQQPVNKEQTK